MTTTKRLSRLKALMKSRGLTSMLITSDVDISYLSGFTGEDSYLLITPGTNYLITDGRFTEQVKKECPRLKAIVRKGSLADAVAEVARRRRIKLLGYDPDFLSVSAKSRLRRALGRATRLKPVAGLVGRLRLIKDPEEVRAITRAIRIAEAAFLKLLRQIKPGQSEREIAALLEYLMRQLGADGPAFKTIVAIGTRSSLPHARPTNRRLPRRGGIILIDWGAALGGYVSDLTRIVFAGKIPPLVDKIYKLVCRARRAAIDAIRPGANLKAVDSAAREIIDADGYGKAFAHGTGHGIGREVHEPPPAAPRSRGKLKTGMVLTIEPAVYLAGRFGIRVEDDVVVTGSGCRVLSRLKKGPWTVRM